MPSPEELELQVKELRAQLAEVSASVVEQEHRAFPILKNFFIERNKWEPGDPRRDAASKALLWRIFFSPGVVAATGGTLALVTAVLLGVQTYLFREQNAAIRESLSQTRDQFQLARRTELLAALYETMPNPEFAADRPESDRNPKVVPRFTARTRGEALLELVALESAKSGESEQRSPQRIGDLTGSLLQQVVLPGANLPHINLELADLSNARLSGANLERSNLRRSRLVFTDLRSANLANADLRGADFAHTALQDACLTGADLRVGMLHEGTVLDALEQGTGASSVALFGTPVSQSQLSTACSEPDHPPKLPDGLKPPPPCTPDVAPDLPAPGQEKAPAPDRD